MRMTSEQFWITIGGTIIAIIFWWFCREAIREGHAESSIRWFFLLR
jgi:hypothetical protein